MEQRAEPRERYLRLTTIRLLDGPLSGIPICTRDITAAGIGLCCTQPLKTGWEFLVTHSPSGSAALYRVVRSRPLPDGTFDIGARFVRHVVPHTDRSGNRMFNVGPPDVRAA